MAQTAASNTGTSGSAREPLVVIADDEIRPHPGPQEAFLSSPADICIGGGSAGGGKTRALLMEPLRHIRVPDFNAVLFRRSFPQLEASGGPWAESEKLYPMTEADSAYMRWKWPSGATVRFSHLQHDKNRLDWKGAQIALILFDQLEDFLESQFWYLLSRNRSVCGVKPYVRATCNPVPADDEVGGWLHRLLDWWIDQDSGYPIMERAGKLRWFLRRSEALHWGDTKDDLIAQFPDTDPSMIKSLSFVPMGIEDNPTLLAKDPAYVGLLEALPYVERMRLRHGNWNVRESTGAMFERMWFGFLPGVLADAPMARVRFWDCAGSAGKGDYTVGTRMARYADGTFVVEDVIRGQWAPGDVDKLIVHVAQGDGYGVRIREEQEPGSSGKAVVATHARLLVGYDYKGVINSGDKITRWKPLASQAQVGHVKIVMGAWNRDWLDEMSHVPDSAYDDCADSASGAFLDLTRYGPARIQRLDGF